MNDSIDCQLHGIVDRSLRSVRASATHKREMHEELLAHVVDVFAEELSRVGDENAALAATSRRFGASDEVLGAIESGVDFEKRIASIYQQCRRTDEIQGAFDLLQRELDFEITDTLNKARQQLLEHFDDEVREKLRVRNESSRASLNRYEQRLMALTRFRQAVEEVPIFGVRVLSVGLSDVVSAVAVSQQYGLLSGDALVVAMMQHHGLVNLASNDVDFDRVPWITRYAPA